MDCSLRVVRYVLLTLLLVQFLADINCQTKSTDDPRFKRPVGMSDAQYSKAMDSVRGKQMSSQQADDWWDKVQEWFKNVLSRLREAGKRVGTFFDKLFSSSDANSGTTPDPTMFNRPQIVPGTVREVTTTSNPTSRPSDNEILQGGKTTPAVVIRDEK